jgi:hypothetical protein
MNRLTNPEKTTAAVALSPVDFRPGASNPGTVPFEIKFKSEDEARLFEQKFT